MAKPKCYFYPNSSKQTQSEVNPYTSMMTEGLENAFRVVNKESPTGKGFFDFLRYAIGVDFLFANWIEELPDKKYGFIQSFLFIFIIKIRKLLGFKFVWVMHNKSTHDRANARAKKILYSFIVKNNDLILTHSSEGIKNATQNYGHNGKNIVFLHHPVGTRKAYNPDQPKAYDVLIWGKISAYKGIKEFVSFFAQNKALLKNRNILIAGKFFSESYYNEVMEITPPQISILNEYVDDNKLSGLISSSKAILFTYNPASVLSSGALMTSLEYPVFIFGPNTAAFADLAEEGIIHTYENFNDLASKLDIVLDGSFDKKAMMSRQEDFVINHSWKKTSLAINKQILQLLDNNS